MSKKKKRTPNRPQGQKNAITEHLVKILDDHIDLSRKDVKAWRDALELATDRRQPIRAELYDIYTNYAIDPFLVGQIEMRILSILNTPFFIYDDTGNIDEEATKIIDQQYFYALLRELMNGIFNGYSLFEFHEVSEQNVSFSTIPYRNILPMQGKILTKAYDINADAFLLDSFDNILPFGDRGDIGILNNAIPHLIWKRHAEQSWSEFCEKFGIPMITAETAKNDDTTLRNIDGKLQELGKSSTAVFPMHTKIDIKQPTNTDAYKVFQERINECNAQISTMIVLSNTLSEVSANRSQTEVHERNLNDKVTIADGRRIEFWVNGVLLPFFRDKGININDSHRFKFDRSAKLKTEELWKITQGLLDTHDISEDWITKTFGIPIEKKKTLSKPPTTTTKQTKSTAQSLTTPVATAQKHFEGCCEDYPEAIAKKSQQKIDDAVHLFAKDLYNNDKKNHALLMEMMNRHKDILDEGLRRDWLSNLTDVKYDVPDKVAYQMMEINLFKFSMAKSAKMAMEMNSLLRKDDGSRKNWSDFKADTFHLNKEYNVHYLRAEYNHAVAVGQSSRNWLSLVKDDTKYIQYQTIGDKRVRNEHQILNGKIFNVDDPEAATINPPNGWGCRCEFVPYLDEPTENQKITGAKAKQLLGDSLKPDFTVNYAKAKQVFTKNLMYLNELNPNITRLKNLTWKDYDLKEKPHSNIALKLSNDTLEQAEEKFLKLLDKNNNTEFKDYFGRSLIISKNNYLKHTKGKHKYIEQKRHLLFQKVEEVLLQPDEVYADLYREKYPQITYVKIYKENIIAVTNEFDKKGNLEIKSWYEQKENAKRKGLLIKKGSNR